MKIEKIEVTKPNKKRLILQTNLNMRNNTSRNHIQHFIFNYYSILGNSKTEYESSASNSLNNQTLGCKIKGELKQVKYYYQKKERELKELLNVEAISNE